MSNTENWKVAGVIAGLAYAEELRKLALVHVLDRAIEEKSGGDEKIAGPMITEAMGLIKKLAPIGKAVGLAAITSATGAAVGKGVGAKNEREKADKELATAMPQAFRTGFLHGARQGFMQGARQGYLHAKGEKA